MNFFKLWFHQTLITDGVGRLLVVEQAYVKLKHVSIVFCFIEFHVVLLHEQVLWLILLMTFLCRISSSLFDRFYNRKKIKDFVRIGSLFCFMFFLPFDPCYSMYTLFLFFLVCFVDLFTHWKNLYLIQWRTYYNEWCRLAVLFIYFGH